MTKYSKKQLLEFLSVMGKANDSIRDDTCEDLNTIVDILTQSQQLAIIIGNDLEGREDDNSSIITILEEYCENLYQLSLSLNDTILNDKLTEEISAQLAEIESEIRNALPEDKKEVVFLPYKASMWDALESVWLAAKEDESCVARVIPIPYFDRNPDGSLGQMHYEGNEYPDYVPITSWEDYNIEAYRPDMIFIHNPYDECNMVTSVHPKFYSKNLKNFTDKLVYIPYFILPEISPNDQAAIDGIKHFILTPGVIYADKVIVQSEEMKRIYICEYIKWAKGQKLQGKHIDVEYQEKRILGSGSPKIDRVLRTKKEDLKIPKEWLGIIQKADGKWKKIILYNSSISALLKHNEKMLVKMESVIQTFFEYKDQIALLWRPHPLLPETIKSMRPELWMQYKQLIEKYKSEEWGIYDESADLDRALVLSDAYYGDESSLVQIYQKIRKPIMFQKVCVEE